MRRSLAEDRFHDDRTTLRLLPRPIPASARVVAQRRGTLSGLAVGLELARLANVRATGRRRDGQSVAVGQTVLELRGDARRILGVERTLLNFLTHLSGVATATAVAVDQTRGSHPRLRVFATRKTLPGLRDLEKLAVVHGGGEAHRRDLSSAVLVKNNHLALLSLREAVQRALLTGGRKEHVEVEVRTASQALLAARAGATALLIDNASPRQARSIVRALERAGLRRGRWVELSGGITPRTVHRYRSVGADAVSLGALTHSAAALPFHLTLRASPGHPRASPPR